MALSPITPTAAGGSMTRSVGPEARALDAEQAARTIAKRFEASFLAEMLKHSGINRTPESTGGGAGEDAFASFLTAEYARMIADRGGIGLAEQIFNAMQLKGSVE